MSRSSDGFLDSPARLAPDPDRALRRLERRRQRRTRALRRLDVAIGLLVGLIAIIVAPGYALAGIIALLVLIAVALSLAVERRRRRPRPRRRRRLSSRRS